MTQDIGTAIKRFEDYPKSEKQIYTVGNEQDYHFKVLFKILDKLGYSWAKECYHLSYGMINLPDGKMKSREGTVVDADELITLMKETAKNRTVELGKIDDFDSKDLERLYPCGLDDDDLEANLNQNESKRKRVNIEYFMEESRQQLMHQVLFVWSSQHEATSYRQGMHEILAVIVMVLEQQCIGGLEKLLLEQKQEEEKSLEEVRDKQNRMKKEDQPKSLSDDSLPLSTSSLDDHQ